MISNYEDLKRHLFVVARSCRRQAARDEMFFGPHDEFTKQTRAAALILEHTIRMAGLEDEYKDWDLNN